MNRPRVPGWLAPLLLLTVVALLDMVVPSEAHLFVLYLIPLMWVATTQPLRTALAFVVLASVLWWLAKSVPTGSFWGNGYRVWNGLSRLVLFYGVVSLVHYLASQLREKERLVKHLRESKAAANPVSGIRRYCRRTDRVQAGDGSWLEIRVWLAREGGVTWVDADSGGVDQGGAKEAKIE